MSKIIKDGNGFVAESLVPDKIESPPVWGDITRKINAYEQYAPTKDSVHNQATISQKKTASAVEAGEDDFSIPLPKDDESAFSDTQDISKPNETPPEPAIDIDAVAEENFNKGVQAGIDRLESDYGATIRTLQSACEQLDILRDTILENSMGELKELVLLLAEKIIRHSLANQKETISMTVEEAIRKAVKSDEFNIIVNPDDLDVIKNRSRDFITSISGLENIVFHADPSVEQGGCIIESSNCTVDATLASQLEILSDYVKSND